MLALSAQLTAPTLLFSQETQAETLQRFRAAAFKEEEAGQYLTLKGVQDSPTFQGLKKMSEADRKKLVETLIKRHPRVYQNTRYDGLTKARDRVSSALKTDVLWLGSEAVPAANMAADELDAIAKNPDRVLAFLLFTRDEMPAVGMEKPVFPQPKEKLAADSEKAVRLLEKELGIPLKKLNQALEAFG